MIHNRIGPVAIKELINITIFSCIYISVWMINFEVVGNIPKHTPNHISLSKVWFITEVNLMIRCEQ